MTIFSFIEDSNRVDNTAELFTLLENTFSEIGFDQVVFSLMTDHPHLELKQGHGVAFNYPEDWMRYYFEKNYAEIDPVRSYMFASENTFSWDVFHEKELLSQKQERFFKEANEAELYNGYGIPLRGTNGAIAGIGLASSDKNLDIDKNKESLMNLISQQFYNCFIDIERKTKALPPVTLTKREKELLKWSARGKSRAQISEILNISGNTIGFHSKNVLKKLDTNHMTVAVIKAINLGIIQI